MSSNHKLVYRARDSILVEFFDALDAILHFLCQHRFSVIPFGGFNIDLFHGNSSASDYNDTLASFDFKQPFTSVTRSGRLQRGPLIDHVQTNIAVDNLL